MEQRSNKHDVEVRASDTPGSSVISGYAAVFNRDSSDMGFIEQVDPSAFNRTLNVADVRALGNHDPNWLLGRSKSGTLRLSTDGTGLRYEIDVNPADPDGQRAIEKIRRGDMDGSSFSFQTIRDEWNWEATPPQRRLLEVALLDIGPVCFPAYPDATSAMRSALEPIAKRCGRDVSELVMAVQSGEIRSLLEPPPAVEEPAPEIVEEPPPAEARVGKMLSAKTHGMIMAAFNSLRDLLDTALEDELSGDPDAGSEENSLRAFMATLTKEQEALEHLVPEGAESIDSRMIVIELRERELTELRQLAA